MRLINLLKQSYSQLNKHQKKRLVGFLVGLSTLSLIAYTYYAATHVATENAYFNAPYVQMGAQVSGTIQQVHVQNFQAVKMGDPIIDIDPAPFELALKEAEAKVAQTEAQLRHSNQNLDRIEKLIQQKYASPEEKDNALTAQDVANANLKLAQTNLEQAKLNLSYTHITAPASGWIQSLTLQPGTVINAKTPLFVLIHNDVHWVDANFKETEVTDIRPGQPASIVFDTYPHHTFQGTVIEISPSSGTAFSLLPPQNASGNWVKVVQRIPVRILITDPHRTMPLRIGTSASVRIKT